MEVQGFKKDEIPVSKVDSKIDDPYSFSTVIKSSVENFEEIPKTLSVTENLKSYTMIISVQTFELRSKKKTMFQDSAIHFFLQAVERRRRGSRRKKRLRTTKKKISYSRGEFKSFPVLPSSCFDPPCLRYLM